MHRRDLELICNIVRKLDRTVYTQERIAAAFADALERDVADFDRALFLKRCGVTDALEVA